MIQRKLVFETIPGSIFGQAIAVKVGEPNNTKINIASFVKAEGIYNTSETGIDGVVGNKNE
jgi:hypothetical protein